MNSSVDTRYHNPLRQLWRENRGAYGLWVTLPTPAVTEIAAELGLDWVCLDLEHSALDYKDVANHARAAKGSGTAVLARVPATTPDYLKRCLDMGVDGVLLPLVNSAEEMRTGLRYGKYPPQGIRGIGGERALRWGLRMDEYLATANEETMVIPLIETVHAIEAAADILAVPDLPAIFFGPADLSASHGCLGQWESPGVAEEILKVREMAQARGIVSGIMAMDDADALKRRDQGFGMIGLGSDFGLLIRSVKPVLKELKGTTFMRRWF
ncbi:2-dehydro-3-deoxyglucarate aldolase [Pigmentiphaga sp. H8]|uniref:HpcH/HpaI aldolase family protein n=1 Tax=Pigmentiphaga sp. H8 TaxID=2488560 RepID=UPI000F5A8C2E|nr:aldolase/citrate lyase family protein [Pigmentiphaga sp. H8]AZG11151.1 2-dehydro-3-deoxyglucarate aldolase [Pigmentiphaga sp. H8]